MNKTLVGVVWAFAIAVLLAATPHPALWAELLPDVWTVSGVD